MSNSSREALIFILQAFVHIYVFILLLRLYLPWLYVSSNNPATQGVLRVTSPLVVPLRRLLPPIGRVDTSTLLIAYGIETLLTLAIIFIAGYPFIPLNLFVTAAVRLVILGIWVLVVGIIVRVILSWTGQGGYNPLTEIAYAVSEPVVRPFRKVIPPVGTFDLSVMVASILLIALTILLGGLKMYPHPL
ncbi:MAG: YggT family protein [Woeseiaceae bacterium]|nr:YggT family protein [Woeseiaceae bacterium]